MTAQDAGGAGRDGWLDMSRYPDTDPDTELSGAEQDMLRTSLAVDETELPDAVWEHMLAVVTGSEATADDDAGAEDGGDPVADEPGWDADPAVELHDDDPTGDPTGDPAGDEDAWSGDAWDGGAV